MCPDGNTVALYFDTRLLSLTWALVAAMGGRGRGVELAEQAVGSRWTPCRPHEPDLARLICLYLNSTPGLLQKPLVQGD